ENREHSANICSEKSEHLAQHFCNPESESESESDIESDIDHTYLVNQSDSGSASAPLVAQIAQRLEAKIGPSAKDAAFVRQVAELLVLGKLSEHAVYDAAEATRSFAERNPVGYFRT